MNLWNKLHHLFEEDDCSLPDIYIENISNREQEKIYQWVMSIAQPNGKPYLRNIEEQRDIFLDEIANPAKLFAQGKIEAFRHGLKEFKIRGILIPTLTIRLDKNVVEFDYRMGVEWGEQEIEALFFFLSNIKQIAPNAIIFHTDEGMYDNPNLEFSEAFKYFLETKAVNY